MNGSMSQLYADLHIEYTFLLGLHVDDTHENSYNSSTSEEGAILEGTWLELEEDLWRHLRFK